MSNKIADITITLSCFDAAYALGISMDRLRTLSREGKIGHVRRANRYFFTTANLAEYRSSGRIVPHRHRDAAEEVKEVTPHRHPRQRLAHPSRWIGARGCSTQERWGLLRSAPPLTAVCSGFPSLTGAITADNVLS